MATAMCGHSKAVALEPGCKTTQCNLAAEANEGAVRFWQKLGFHIVGRLPGAFRHPERDFDAALVMYKWLC